MNMSNAAFDVNGGSGGNGREVTRMDGARAAWSHQLTAQQVAQFAPRVFLAGKDRWDPEAAAAKLP